MMIHTLPEPQQRRDAADLSIVPTENYAAEVAARTCRACQTETPQRDIGLIGDEDDVEVLQVFVCGVCGTTNSRRVPNPARVDG